MENPYIFYQPREHGPAVSRFSGVDNAAARAKADGSLSSPPALPAPHPRARSRKAAARGLVLAAAAAVTSCAASFQTMYEGDVLFEHCYRLDIDSAVASSEKRGCWERWLATHTRGQTRDRVEFAAARSRTLASGSAAPSVAMLRIGQVPGLDPAGTTSVACPLPETPFEAPPTLAAQPKSSASVAATLVPAPKASARPAQVSKGKPCLDVCTADLTSCADKCSSPRCSQKCGDDVKRCMTACL